MRRPRLAGRLAAGRHARRDRAVVSAAALADGSASAARATSGGDGVTSILLVEDNRDYAEMLRGNLEREGYDVHVASSGLEGLEQAKARSPDLIILDLMLPAMNG